MARSRPRARRRRRRPRVDPGGGRRCSASSSWLLMLVAILAPLLAPHDPEAIESVAVLRGPTWSHPFGSDALGRDVLTRVLYAFRVSLSVAIGSVVLAFAIGVPLGLLAGFRGGWVDTVIMRPLDMLLALPALLLAITLIAIVGPGTVDRAHRDRRDLPAHHRPGRPWLRPRREGPAVRRRRAPGGRRRARSCSGTSCRTRSGPTLIQATVLIGFAIQIEAALSFLGLGAQPPTPSLGVMLNEGRDVLTLAPWVEIFPGVAIAITVLAFTLIGDGLRRLDPRGMAR